MVGVGELSAEQVGDFGRVAGGEELDLYGFVGEVGQLTGVGQGGEGL